MTDSISKAIHSLVDALPGIGSKDKTPPVPEPQAEDVKELREKYEKADQGHVFAFYGDLSIAEKASLYSQAKDFDPERINKLADTALNPPKNDDEENSKPDLKPLPASATSSILDSATEDLTKWYDSGLDLIAENKVGVVLMAGGQGTRLGSSAPKGCYDIGLPSKKSLFQLQAERIYKVQQLAAKKHSKDNVVVPWYVMTSGPTRKPTEDFFREHNFFGLEEENVLIFEQGVLPCISNEGKILLESKSKIAVAPDGNGGLYNALIKGGAVGDMQKRGIQHIHAYCVDNCLVRVADPVFIGFSASKDVDIATKVVRKRNAKESVGLILQKNGKPDVVEYSEIDSETAEAKDGMHSDLLKFRAANIVNHYYSFSFLESIPSWSHKLPHHVAKKKIPCIDTDRGTQIKPEKPNGIKLEQFVFDCFPFLDMEKFACMEVKREDEFSPLKNAKGTGEDDPDTSKMHILTQGRRWLQDAGAIVEDEGEGEGVEVSPLISYGGEGLDFLSGKTIKAPAVIEKPNAHDASKPVKSGGKTHARDGGDASIVPKKVQEVLPGGVEKAVPNAIHDTRDDATVKQDEVDRETSNRKTHAKDDGEASIVPKKIQEALPESVERAVPNVVHDTGDKPATDDSKWKTHAKNDGEASVVPKKVQEALPESVERAVPNAVHDTGDKKASDS